MIKLLAVISYSFFGPSMPADSLGLETINGKRFIIHKVDEKETLYAISRRYGTTVDAVLEFNKGAANGLEIGQILKVPYVAKPQNAPVVTASNATTHKVVEKETLFSISRLYNVTVDEIKQWNNLKDNTLALGQELIIRGKTPTNNSINTISSVEQQSLKGTHTVQEKETLYSIARQYGVSVDQLRAWNYLSTDELKIGQVLVLSQPKENSSTTQNLPPASKQPVTVAKETPRVEVREEPKTEKVTISESVRGSDEVVQAGVAELIEGTEGNRKYLALHRTAPVGTILKVRNEMNNREVFVRVMGKLPDTAQTTNVIIKVSRSAYDRLGAIDPKFRVEVTYYK